MAHARAVSASSRYRAFNNTEIEAVGEFAGSSEYRGVERLKAYTQATDMTGITYGKFRPLMGAESRVEEQVSPFQHVSTIASLASPPAALGVTHHAARKFDYDVGLFSSDYDPDLGGFSGDGMLNLSMSRTFYEKVGKTVSRNRWHADHFTTSMRVAPIHTDMTSLGVARRMVIGLIQNPAYRHLFSTGITIDTERTSFIGDFQFAKGDTTVWGLTLDELLVDSGDAQLGRAISIRGHR